MSVQKIVEKLNTPWDENCQSRISTFKTETVEISVEFLELNKIYYPRDIVRIKLGVNAKNNPNPKKVIAALAYHIPVGYGLVSQMVDTFFDSALGLSKEQMFGTSRIDLERGFNQLMKKEIDLCGQNNQGVCQVYDLELQIPEKIIPTYHGGSQFITVRWFVRVMDNSNTDQDLCELEEIIVAHPAPEQDIPADGKLHRSKKAELRIELPKKNWSEGEDIQGKFYVRPLDPKLTNMDIDVKLMVLEHADATQYNNEVVSKNLATNVSLLQGVWTEFPFTLSIPHVKCPSFIYTWNNHLSGDRHVRKADWCVIGRIGKSAFSPSVFEEIDVTITSTKKDATSSAQLGEKKNATDTPIAQTSAEPNIYTKHRDEIVRIRSLHIEIGKAKSKQNARVTPIIFGAGLGILACFCSAIPLVFIFASFGGEAEASPWPGLIGIVIMLAVWIASSILIRRRNRKKATEKVLQLESALNTEITTLAKKDPDWVELVGGDTVLLNPAVVEQLLLKMGAMRV